MSEPKPPPKDPPIPNPSFTIAKSVMDLPRIAALLEPFLGRELSPLQLEKISTYIDLLLRWNARINLTAIRQPEEIVARHFGESFFLARHVFPARADQTLLPASPSEPPETQASSTAANAGALRVIDLGSGAGFPAMPLKIWAPEIHLTLIESNHKKVAFLREVARILTLTNVDVISERAETLAANPEFPRADVVTFRAVEKFDQILPTAATLMAPNARLAILIGSAQVPKLAIQTTLTWQSIPIPRSEARVLSIGIPSSSGN